MWIRQLICAFFGLSCGFLVAGAVFALITSIGVIPRMAGKSHTGSSVKLYEMCVFFGGSLGNIFFIYKIDLYLGIVVAAMFGLFAGIFLGCLATAIAETLNTTAVFSRRSKLKKGLGIIILFLALGKFVGTFFYYYKHWY